MAAASVMTVSPCLSAGSLPIGLMARRLRLPVLSLLEADELDLVRLAQLLQHPMHNRRARRRRVVQRDPGHTTLRTSVCEDGAGSGPMWHLNRPALVVSVRRRLSDLAAVLRDTNPRNPRSSQDRSPCGRS